MARPTPASTAFVDAAEQKVEQHAGFSALFDTGRARDTVAIWAAFFMCLLAVYSAFSWLPTMLASEGLSPAIAGSGLTAYNLGGVFGALICAVVITRFGSRWPIVICGAGAALTAYLLQGVNVAQDTNLFIAGIGLHGLFVNAVQCSLYALCAFVYPTLVRATGTASALAFGRLGAILSSFAGAAVITAGGAHAYLTLLGSAMVVTLVAMLVVRRHIPQVGSVRMAPVATVASH